MGIFINIGVFFSLLITGYVFGQMAERKHFKQIRKNEAKLAKILAFNGRKIPAQFAQLDGILVSGSVVIAVDYFKVVAAGIKNIFGGRITAYESLLERARREAIIRMKIQAQTYHAEAVFNLRIDTSAIGQGQKKNTHSVEVHAYGTALIPRKSL